MANYHNAVSDKLVVSVFLSHIVYATFSKDSVSKNSWIKSINEAFPEDLEGAIFSSTHVIVANSNFILLPFSEDTELQGYSLNFSETSTCSTSLLDDIKVVYEMPSSTKEILAKLVNVTLESDASVGINYSIKKAYQNALFFYEVNEVLTVFAIKNGKLALANRYKISNEDELFYFVMLVVEQLEFPVESLKVGCVSSKGEHENYQSLFKNYLPNLDLIFAGDEPQSTDYRAMEILAAFFSQCVL